MVVQVSEEKHEYKYNYSICVSPLFGSVLAKRLVEFLELTRILGAQQVFFYDFHVSSVIERVLRFYQDKVRRCDFGHCRQTSIQKKPADWYSADWHSSN